MAVGTRLPLGERLRGSFARRGRGVEAVELATFARQLFARGAGYVEELADEEAAALVASAFRFFTAPGPALRVRAIVPTYASEGWDAPVAVLETAMPDRPFIVDTIRCCLAAAGIPVETLLHPIFTARRDAEGRLALLAPPEAGEPHESFVHVAVPRTTDAGRLGPLCDEIRSALEDVRLVTDDFPAMIARAQAIAAELDTLGRARAAQAAADATAAADFLRWLVDGAFVFLGYREYGITTIGGASQLQVRAGSGLGLLRREERSAFRDARRMDELSETVRARLLGGRLVTVTKTVAEAPVHRRAPMDDVGVKQLDAEGRVIGERRFLGLFSSKAYAEEAAETPLLRRTLRQILAAEQVVPGSHDHKEIVAVFNALPKSDLFAGTPAEIQAEIEAVLAAGRDDGLVVSTQARPAAERVAVLVVLPRERFSSEARDAIRELLRARVGGRLLDEHLVIGEDGRALLHFAFAAAGASLPADAELHAALAALVRSWGESLRDVLVTRHGEAGGERLAARFAPAFSEAYQAEVPPERAAEDVGLLDAVEREGGPRLVVRDAERVAGTTELRVYRAGVPFVLSEFVPVLENLGLRALAEDQIVVTPRGGGPLGLQSFFVQDRRGRRLDAGSVGPRLIEALLALGAGRTDDDPLNRLVVEAELEWRAVACLRAYAGYAAQIGLAARPIVLAALADHPGSARLLFTSFAARFRPEGVTEEAAALRQRFVESLESVQSLREDLLLRALLDLVQATVRTNFYAPGPARDHLALKLRSADLVQLPPPRPLYEIYVHGPTVEGIHLRAGKVARGGIRWSERPEDFRAEVLGLMKTQTVKNAIIVPTGAKGGFIVKRGAPVVEAYRTFVGALLELTDNVVAGRVVHPRGLVVHDEEDPYLVVAADKGTAAFSDVANAEARGYWLGDAFASGGSHGYDHKALGITSRGAWECVRGHFHDLGVDADAAPLAVAGIGDPSGDVFGNGMLRSRHLRLVAAFNHRHVFLDPNPDPARSFAERERLFRAVRGWDAYDPAALSRGGAVVSRAAKRVVLSPEAQAMLGLAEPAVSGEQLVQAVLGLDVDLLFNGGIGTYVRATDESDAEVHDTVNDPVRVPASALRAKVVGEGGNLGLTPRARVEYALAGGRINTDAVDNSAGVDMSDHEVNLKICLRVAVEDGRLTGEARNALLAEVTDEVAARVLAHNRAQSRLLSLDEIRSRRRLPDFRALATELERAGLDRAQEVLPDGDALRARRGTFLGLTRPELAVLMAWTKIQLQRDLLASAVPDDPFLEGHLLAWFPAPVVARFPDAVRAHPLRRQIVATEVANTVVDELGTTFLHRVRRDTGASVADAVCAWAIAWAIADAPRLVAAIAAGGFTAEVERTCRFVLEQTSERATKWILANTDPARPARERAAELGAAIGRVRSRLPDWIAGAEAEAFHKLRSELEMAGLPGALARELATADWLTGALDVVTIAREVAVDPEAAAARYYGLGQHLDFAWLWARLADASEADEWQRRAVEGMVEDLLRARRRLTRLALERGADVLPERALAGVQALVRDLRTAPRVGLAALEVVVREIRRLAETG